jgi:peptidoglycan/xylan/chitin deacetylase (PgdA/CDA1 family)
VRDDLTRGTEAICRASGLTSLRHFRAPHGFRSPWVTSVARSLGQRTVGWSLGVWDSARPGAAEIARRTQEGMKAGSILLLHDGDGYDAEGDRLQTADALPTIIHGLRARGFRFVTLPD